MKFTKKDASKLKRVGMSWRRPRGRKNKTKVGKKGHRPVPAKGFRTSLDSRYKIGGKIPVLIYNTSQLEKLNESNTVIIASAVGAKNRSKILEACRSKGLKVVNDERNVENSEKASK